VPARAGAEHRVIVDRGGDLAGLLIAGRRRPGAAAAAGAGGSPGAGMIAHTEPSAIARGRASVPLAITAHPDFMSIAIARGRAAVPHAIGPAPSPPALPAAPERPPAADAERSAAHAERSAAHAERSAAHAEPSAAHAEPSAADAEPSAADAERSAADAERSAADAERSAADGTRGGRGRTPGRGRTRAECDVTRGAGVTGEWHGEAGTTGVDPAAGPYRPAVAVTSSALNPRRSWSCGWCEP
jgi:hypothetical protein